MIFAISVSIILNVTPPKYCMLNIKCIKLVFTCGNEARIFKPFLIHKMTRLSIDYHLLYELSGIVTAKGIFSDIVHHLYVAESNFILS